MFLLTALRQIKNGERICGNPRYLCPIRKGRRTFLWWTHSTFLWWTYRKEVRFCKLACAQKLAKSLGMIVAADSFTTETGVYTLTLRPPTGRETLQASLS